MVPALPARGAWRTTRAGWPPRCCCCWRARGCCRPHPPWPRSCAWVTWSISCGRGPQGRGPGRGTVGAPLRGDGARPWRATDRLPLAERDAQGAGQGAGGRGAPAHRGLPAALARNGPEALRRARDRRRIRRTLRAGASKGSGITRVSQLRGARLLVQAMSAGPESLPLRWVERQLRDQGLPPAARHFSGVEYEVQASRVLLPVFFGQAPACVVTERSLRTVVELNPQVGAQLERIAVSPPLIDFVMCLAPTVDPSLAPRYAELAWAFPTTRGASRCCCCCNLTASRRSARGHRTRASLVEQ